VKAARTLQSTGSVTSHYSIPKLRRGVIVVALFAGAWLLVMATPALGQTTTNQTSQAPAQDPKPPEQPPQPQTAPQREILPGRGPCCAGRQAA